MSSICLSVGLNSVDPAAYNGWSGPLNACENDARDMQRIAMRQGFHTRTLLTADATAAAVLEALHRAARDVRPGEQFILTYSGHGSQVPDVSGDEARDQGPPDNADETWCLYDRMLLDDELFAMWARFRAGVRILMLSDSCHSGTMAKAMALARPAPAGQGEYRAKRLHLKDALPIYQRNKGMYDALQFVAGPAEKAAIAARVILISGCQDHQESLDGPLNGAFTGALLQVWDDGAFTGSHPEFHAKIAARLAGTSQTPNYFTVGAAMPEFEAQTPFTP